MEKRYQVFISSTFQDLQNARQEVSQALLRADCFPAGMELFPAADEEQFEFIKTVIDQSDYYIIISAGRYGSIHPETGLSYTEMEYDYAVEIGKPVIRLLHKDPFNELKGEFIEQTDAGRQKLQALRNRLQTGRLVKFWSDEKELGSAVDHSLRHLNKVSPGEGWVRASDARSDLELQNAKLNSLLAKEKEKSKQITVAGKLEASLPTVNELLKKAGFTDRHSLFSRVAAPLEERVWGGSYSTNTDISADALAKEISSFLKDDIDLAYAIVHALAVEGILKQKVYEFGTPAFSLSPKGMNFISQFRVFVALGD